MFRRPRRGHARTRKLKEATILETAVDRSLEAAKKVNMKTFPFLSTLIHWVSRYEVYCTSLAPHGGVASPRNGTTIPRRRALPCATMNVHYISSNYGF